MCLTGLKAPTNELSESEGGKRSIIQGKHFDSVDTVNIFLTGFGTFGNKQLATDLHHTVQKQNFHPFSVSEASFFIFFSVFKKCSLSFQSQHIKAITGNANAKRPFEVILINGAPNWTAPGLCIGVSQAKAFPYFACGITCS